MSVRHWSASSHEVLHIHFFREPGLRSFSWGWQTTVPSQEVEQPGSDCPRIWPSLLRVYLDKWNAPRFAEWLFYFQSLFSAFWQLCINLLLFLLFLIFTFFLSYCCFPDRSAQILLPLGGLMAHTACLFILSDLATPQSLPALFCAALGNPCFPSHFQPQPPRKSAPTGELPGRGLPPLYVCQPELWPLSQPVFAPRWRLSASKSRLCSSARCSCVRLPTPRTLRDRERPVNLVLDPTGFCFC